MKDQKTDCRKIQYKKVTFEHKLFVIAQITNGQISINYASKKYDISRSSLNYWIKKYARVSEPGLSGNITWGSSKYRFNWNRKY